MDELTNHYFSEEISGYLTIDHLNQLSGVAKSYDSRDFRIMKEQKLCGVYAKNNLVISVFGEIYKDYMDYTNESEEFTDLISVFEEIYEDYMDYTNESEEFTDFEPIGRN